MFAETLPIPEYGRLLPQCRVGVRIGEVSLALSGDSCEEVFLNPELEEFLSEVEQAEIEVSVKSVPRLRPYPGVLGFDSGAVWKLFHDESDLAFDFTSPTLGSDPYKRMRVDRDFRHAEITLNRELLRDCGPVSPLEYPTDELLITNYLASGVGVEVHGCGLVDPETGGYLFLGHSGAGKSTTTRLWTSLRNAKILSDDRIILRLHHGELWMYGTPWHGEAAFATAGKAKLERIFILQHGQQNTFLPMPRALAVGELFARCFPPFHSAAGLESTIDFLNRVVDAVPCYEFHFVPESNAVEAVLGFHNVAE